MEDALAQGNWYGIAREIWDVLILVLMEDALARVCFHMNGGGMTVLILVLMEDALARKGLV